MVVSEDRLLYVCLRCVVSSLCVVDIANFGVT